MKKIQEMQFAGETLNLDQNRPQERRLALCTFLAQVAPRLTNRDIHNLHAIADSTGPEIARVVGSLIRYKLGEESIEQFHMRVADVMHESVQLPIFYKEIREHGSATVRIQSDFGGKVQLSQLVSATNLYQVYVARMKQNSILSRARGINLQHVHTVWTVIPQPELS